MTNESTALTFTLKGIRSLTQDCLKAEVNNVLNKLAANMGVKLGSATHTLDDVVITWKLSGTAKGTTACLQLHDGPQTLASTGLPARLVLAIAINLEYFYDLTLTASGPADLTFVDAGLKVARMIEPDMPEPSFISELRTRATMVAEIPDSMDFRK